jgi:hypothetical protein
MENLHRPGSFSCLVGIYEDVEENHPGMLPGVGGVESDPVIQQV